MSEEQLAAEAHLPQAMAAQGPGPGRHMATEEVDSSPPVDFRDTQVLTYLLANAGGSEPGGVAAHAAGEPVAQADRLCPFGSLEDPAQPKIRWYSIAGGGDVVAAGGKGGSVAVFHLPGNSQHADEAHEPLLSFKAHAGWVSEVRLVRPGAASMRAAMVTTANDGMTKLWDLTKAAGGMPKLVNTQRWHSSGIWAMDLSGTSVATASKVRDGGRCGQGLLAESACMRGALAVNATSPNCANPCSHARTARWRLASCRPPGIWCWTGPWPSCTIEPSKGCSGVQGMGPTP